MMLIAFKDAYAIDLTHKAVLNNSIVDIPHSSKIITESHQLTCCVCRLEEGIQSQLLNSFIIKKADFQALTCFQIAHYPLMSRLCNCIKHAKEQLMWKWETHKR